LFAGCDPLEGAPSIGELEASCAGCHPAQAEQHALSRHAAAEASPVFRALRDRADTDFCDACHRPIGCIDCHAAVGNEAVKNGLMLWNEEGPVRGPTGVAPGAPHATRRSEYLTSSDLCGTCHQVEGPAGFAETPYTHWLHSPAAARKQTCSDCHTTHRRTVPYGEGARLVLGETLRIDHSEGGHHFPDGASFLRGVDVVLFDEGVEVDRVPLHAELDDGSRPVVLPTDGVLHVRQRGVEAGTVREMEVQEADSACFELRRFRVEVLDALGLALPEEVQSFGCVSRTW
jgi:hypothetical protein